MHNIFAYDFCLKTGEYVNSVLALYDPAKKQDKAAELENILKYIEKTPWNIPLWAKLAKFTVSKNQLSMSGKGWQEDLE